MAGGPLESRDAEKVDNAPQDVYCVRWWNFT